MIKRLLLVAFLIFSSPAFAVTPSEMLSDPALEARARTISQQLRCLVCQNENIDDSNAELAHDLRTLVRDRLTKGDSDQQVFDYVVSRYGDYVLLKPPFKPSTYPLWLAPPLFLVLGAFGVWRFYRSRRDAVAAPGLSEEDRTRLASLLQEKKDAS